MPREAPIGEVKVVSSRTGSLGPSKIANQIAALAGAGSGLGAPRYPVEAGRGKSGSGGQGPAPPAPDIPIVPIIGTRPSTPGAPAFSAFPTITITAARPRRAPKPKPRPRRAPKPKPKPRPRRRPLPRKFPRIPIAVPGALRFALGRLAGLLGLVPAYMGVLKAVDTAAQDNWTNLLFGALDDDRNRDQLFGPGSARSTASVERPAPDLQPLESVTVTGGRLGTQPVSRPARTPSPVRALEPSELPYPHLGPQTVPRPVPRPSPAPQPALQPLGSPVNAPSLQPLTFAPPAPAPRTNPRRKPRPSAPPRPSPLTPFKPGVLSLPAPQPVPKPNLDKCKCPGESKPKKKRQDRTECKTGTYRQLAKGIVYTPKRTVPCQ